MKTCYKVFAFIALLLAGTARLSAQELNCTVTVLLSPKAQYTNTQLLKSMETSIRDFLNTRKWTADKFEANERIQCNVQITIENVSGNDFSGLMQISATRPVYGSNYTTATFNFNDKNIAFTYAEFQTMDYQENNFTTELTSMLAYYANVILGYDYDSFSPMGGTPFFQKAQNIVNAAQSSPNSTAWSAMSKDIRNRYFLISQLMDDRYQAFRKAFYSYHRQGLDYMFQDNAKGLDNIMSSLTALQDFNKSYPNTVIVSTFFFDKSYELINIFSQAPQELKQKAKEMLVMLDVADAQRYEDGLK
jgi:hypothetical protein